ncbi:heparinase II/III family protein [Planctomycetota bacterium]|nr:heparinase II/III family protein [Planctomycetota bacterium]
MKRGLAERLGSIKVEHPRLGLSDAEVGLICDAIERGKPVAREWFTNAQIDADSYLSEEILKYEIEGGLRLLYVAQEAVRRMYTLCLTYRITKEKRYAKRAIDELLNVCWFTDWNPRHFLDCAEMTHAVSIGYDWLHDELNKRQRKVIVEAIVKKGLQPGLECFEKKIRWTFETNNWNLICATGMIVGCLAVSDLEREIANDLFSRCIDIVKLPLDQFAPDGGWFEGPAYWRYTTEYMTLLFRVLQSSLGTDFGLSKKAGIAETAKFPIYMIGPTYRFFNYADSVDEVKPAPHLLDLANRYCCKQYAKFHMHYHNGAAMELCYYQPSFEDIAAKSFAEIIDAWPLDLRFEDVNAFAMRSSWSNDAWFVAANFGRNGISHSQLDIGTFVLDAHGKRFICDLGMGDYNAPGYFLNQRWQYYRMRAEGNNTLVLKPNDETELVTDQDTPAGTKCISFNSSEECCTAKYDMSEAYQSYANQVVREFELNRKANEKPSVIVSDKICCPKNTEIYWFAHTEAEINILPSGRSAKLIIGHTEIQTDLLEPHDAVFTKCEASPMNEHATTMSVRNTGFQKLSIRFKATTEISKITVQFS